MTETIKNGTRPRNKKLWDQVKKLRLEDNLSIRKIVLKTGKGKSTVEYILANMS